MVALPPSIILTIAVLTIFLCFITALKYAVENDFIRTRLTMSAFFFFIVATLTICFYQFFFITLPYTIPAGLAGILVGYFVGVRAAEVRLKMEGLRHYVAHFSHLHLGEGEFNWWSVINFYSVMCALVLINLVGLTTVILQNLEPMALFTSSVGAFLVGTIIPYLAHLWSIKPPEATKSTTSEA